MIVLHLQIRKDGAIRAMLNMKQGKYVKVIYSTLFAEPEDARLFYSAIFGAYDVEAIHVRVWHDGWMNPQELA